MFVSLNQSPDWCYLISLLFCAHCVKNMLFTIYALEIKKQKALTRSNIQETKLRIKFKILRYNFVIVHQLQKLSALYSVRKQKP